MEIKLLPLICIVFILGSCETSDYSPYTYSNEATIFSETESVEFRELLLILKPYLLIDNQKHYLLTDTLREITIKVNNMPWGQFNSFGIDPGSYTSNMQGNLLTTTEEIGYSIVAPLTPPSDTLSTAGEYANLLNRHFTLQPGFYFIAIESFSIFQKDQTIRKITTPIIEPLEILPDTRSAYLGEFEIQIN